MINLFLIFLVLFIFFNILKKGIELQTHYNKMLVGIIACIAFLVLMVGNYKWYMELKTDGHSEWDVPLMISGFLCIVLLLFSLMLHIIFKIIKNLYWSKTFAIACLSIIMLIALNSIIIGLGNTKQRVIENNFKLK